MGLAPGELWIGTIKERGKGGQRISGRHAAVPIQEKISLYAAMAVVEWVWPT